MDVKSVCTSLLAESDAQNKTISAPNVASVTDADKVINIKLGSAQVEGDCLSSDSGGRRDEELLKGLLTDDYCHVCEAVLLFESQRLSHYEGKKHSQKLRVYLQAKRAEKMRRHPSTSRQTMTTDKDRFCELCNMVFSSPVVARSHYEGKVHSKNLGKKGLQPKDRYTESSATQDSDNAEQKSVGNNNTEPLLDPTVGTATPSKEVNLKDPNKHCALCAASFNNPQMALQHYNGRKHQRRQARQELLQDLGDDVQQENPLMCSMCSLQFNSVEMYQAHMQGNKHQTKEKKVVDLCSSQQKAYSTFADELSDYIQVQRARGITPKNSEVLTTADKRQEDEEDEHDQVFNKGDISEVDKSFPNPPPSSNPHHSRLGCYNPGERRRPPYQGSFWPSDGWHYNGPPPVFPGTGSALISSMPIKRRRHRKHSSSSSYDSSSSYSSSYSSSDSSSTSDSDDSEYKHREKRRMRNSRRERDRRALDKDSDRAEKMRKRRRKDKGKESVERKRRESGDVKEERRKRKMKGSGKRGRQEKKSPEENVKEGEEGGMVMDKLMPEDVNYNGNEGEVHMNVEEGDGGQFEQAKPKYRKEKKKTKEKVDSRTEDEKLWDDSILGC